MTDNPLGGLGGLDLGALLGQAQQMQQAMVEAQERLAAATVEGSAGAVRVTVSGVGDLVGVTIATGAFDPADEESLTDLGDLIVAAYRDGKQRADDLAAQSLGPLTGGLDDFLGGGDDPGGGDQGGEPPLKLGF
jgi:DNA-binding protein YbaB